MPSKTDLIEDLDWISNRISERIWTISVGVLTFCLAFIVESISAEIREHGEDADLEAAQRADAMLEKGRLDGQRVWKRVLAAVKEIQRQEPREGEAVN